jgi:hypothetical protein
VDRSALLCPRSSVVWRDLDGVVILLDAARGRYFRLEGSGAAIWRRLDSAQTLPSLISATAAAFGVPTSTVESDVQAFVDDAVADGLIEALSDSPQRPDARPSDRHMLQIGRSRLIVSKTIELLQEEFSRQHYVRLPHLIEPSLLDLIMSGVESGEFVDRQHTGIGTELYLVPGVATSVLQLLFNDPNLLHVVGAIAGGRPPKCFDGRVYRMIAGAGHYDSWHSDAAEDRLVAISVNLSREPYEGGVLEIRPAESVDPPTLVPNPEFGSAVMFRISPALRHRVGPVRGMQPRTAYAGWFRASPDFQSLFFASLPKN